VEGIMAENDKKDEEVRVDQDELATDEELALAFEDMIAGLDSPSPAPSDEDDNLEAKITPAPDPEPKTRDDEDRRIHEESSRLGRKVAWLDDHMATKDDIDEIKRMIKGMKREDGDYNYDEEKNVDLNTVDGIEKFLDERDRKRDENRRQAQLDEQKRYSRQYIDVMEGLLDQITDESKRDKIRTEMSRNGGEFNKRYTDSPGRDCAKNFNLVIRSLNRNVFQKEDRVPDVPVGSGVKNGEKGQTKKNHQLDDIASDYVKSMRLTADFINEALDGEAPMNLRGKRG
jgi:hypothetical protein